MTSATHIGYIALPDSFAATPDQRKAVIRLVNSRLPVEVDVEFRTEQPPRYALLSVAPAWPTVVHFADVIPIMQACKPGTVLMGLTRTGEPFYRAFTGDTPHWGFSVNTGFGKSTMFCVTGAQILHQESDSTLICIDPKAVSFNPLIGIPGVTVYNDFRDVQGMWQGIRDHLAILYRRMEMLSSDPTLTFPTQVLMLDELNMFSMLTEGEWAEERQARQALGESRLPATPPIWKDLAMSLYAGRQFGCYVVIMAQRLDDRSTGRLGLQTILNLKAMAGFGAQDWKRFIGTNPVPLSSSTCGRWIYTDGQTRTWVQNTYSDIKDGMEIRNYAMANRSGLHSEVASDPITGVRWIEGIQKGADHLGISPDAFRQRRKRNPIPGEEKQANKPLWRENDLAEWAKQWDKEAISN
jgi:hypothetical protein